MSSFLDESPSKMRAALNRLIVDETEAIAGYDEVLACDSLSPENRAVLEEIRNDEIDHIAKLTDLYKKFATGAMEESVAKSLFGDKRVSDYSARGSFGSLAELKSYYPGAKIELGGSGVVVMLNSGAELNYSFGSDGKLIFIRGRD